MGAMRHLLAVLTGLMLFATPVVAGNEEDALAAYKPHDYQKAFRLFKPIAVPFPEGCHFCLIMPPSELVL
jgi:hypothetical protein